ncbi:MAG: hypothetical protein ACI3XZ_06220 [Butyricicoccus sp.]
MKEGKDNLNYKALYYALFNDVSRAIEQLQQVQTDAEERYLTMGDE